MLVVGLVVLAGFAVFVIAAVLVGREAHLLDNEPPRPVFDLVEAVAWVAERLPGEVTAVLSPADVAQILDWSLECLATAEPDRHASQHEGGDGETVVEDDDAVAFVLARAEVCGHGWTAAEVTAVLVQQTAYLEVIGAVSSLSPERGGGPTADSL